MTDPHHPNNDANPAQKIPGREASPQRRRFYSTVSVKLNDEQMFAIFLDERSARTPGKHSLATPIAAYTEAVAAEWRRQGAAIIPSTMPITAISCSAIDVVDQHRDHVAGEIANYAANDHLYYRASEPEELARLHAAGWDPVVAWASQQLGVSLETTTGLMPIEQVPQLKEAVLRCIQLATPFELAALHVLTTLTGSALLAMAVWRKNLDIETAWHLAHIDEDWQIKRWGHDTEATARRESRHRTAIAASSILGFFDI